MLSRISIRQLSVINRSNKSFSLPAISSSFSLERFFARAIFCSSDFQSEAIFARAVFRFRRHQSNISGDKYSLNFYFASLTKLTAVTTCQLLSFVSKSIYQQNRFSIYLSRFFYQSINYVIHFNHKRDCQINRQSLILINIDFEFVLFVCYFFYSYFVIFQQC